MGSHSSKGYNGSSVTNISCASYSNGECEIFTQSGEIFVKDLLYGSVKNTGLKGNRLTIT